MKKGNLIPGSLAICFCLIIACTKTKDNHTVDRPITNNPIPNQPKDSTPNPNPNPTPPTFTDFSPVTAFIGDTITLTGTNLGNNINALHATFGTVSATVISASNTSAKVVVPDDIEQATGKIQLTVNDTTLSSDKNFMLKAPVIESISYTKGFPGESIDIKGRGFRNSRKLNQIMFGTTAIDKGTGLVGNKVLTMRVPDRAPAGNYAISVTVAGMTATATDSFTVIRPSIQSISSDSGTVYSEVTITGNNLKDINGGRTAVFFSDWKTGQNSRATYIHAVSDNQVTVEVPNMPAGTYKISVMVLGAIVDFTQKPFTVKDL